MTAVGFKPTPLRGWKRRGQKRRGTEIKGNGSEEKRFYKREISREKAKRQEKYMVHVSDYCGKSRRKCILRMLTASHGGLCLGAICCCGRMLAINLRSGLLRQGCRRVTSSRCRKKSKEKEMSKEPKERDVQRRFSHCAGPLTYRLRLLASCSFPYACTVYAM